MLTLLLLRHAKAVPQQHGEDFERGLTEKGAADAAALGAHMAELKILPDLSLVSAAERTRQTFALFADAARAPLKARYEASLYNATDHQLRDILRYVDPSIGTLMIVGHNPGIMDVAALMSREGDTVDLARLHNRFPPGALAVIAFDAEDWPDARARGGRLDLLLMPEDLAPRG